MLTNSHANISKDMIEADICVIGAGPAGITFAREYIGLPIRVSLLESGLFENDERAQELSWSTTESFYHTSNALAEGRRRQFGGTANLWSYHTEPGSGRLYARSLPPEALDFEEREGQPDTAWPFGLEAIRAFYERAQSTWNGGPFEYGIGTWADAATPPLPFHDGLLTTRMCQHGPTDVFTLRYRDDLLAADNVRVHVGCTAVELESDGKDGMIRRVRVARSNGPMFSVAAKVFVLAAGGVENVQLLLLSEFTRPGGPGNLHDNVGRYFTDHPEFRMGTIAPTDTDLFDSIGLYDIRWVGRFLVSGLLTITEAAKKHGQLLNMSGVLVPMQAGFGSAAHRSLYSLLAIRRGEIPANALADVRSIISAPRDVVALLCNRNRRYQEYSGGWSRRDVDRRRFSNIEVHAATEQTPDRENRIVLADDRDWLGRRQVKLRWRWSESDRQNIGRSIGMFAAEIERARIGRFTRWVELEGPGRRVYPGLHHPMGGTRMHPDPRRGVVDEDCRVHGTTNLYVTGSSVFATGHGYANPTLTILALTIRLADHVKTLLVGEV